MTKRLKLLYVFLLLLPLLPLGGHAQQITMRMHNVTVKEAIEAFKQETGKSMFFEVGDIDLNRKINVDIENKTMEEALVQILKGQGLTYDIKGNYVVISKIPPKRRVNGIVTDANNEALSGATVHVPETQIATVTDNKGAFSLEVPGNKNSLIVSFLGFDPKEVSIPAGNRPMTIVLQPNAEELSEIVVVGYGTQKKENLTGALAVVKGDALAGRAGSNVSQLLLGAVPNMQVTLGSGRPGQTGSFNIRGVNSISSSASPLVIIDGIEGDINRINANDVESVTVFKDASSSAIYGARASYGVIMVTTKRGSKDKLSLTYNGRYSISSPTTSTDYETRGYYSAGINDMFFSSWQGTPYTTYTEEDYHELWIRRNDKTEHPDRPWVVEKNGRYKYYANTDWYGYLYNHTRPTWDHNLSISGGSDKITYLLSGNFQKQKGILKINPDVFKRYNFRSKISAKVMPWLEINNNTAYFHSDYFYPGKGGINNIFSGTTGSLLASFVPVNPDGSLTFMTTNNNGYALGGGQPAMLINDKHRNNDKVNEFATTFEAVFTPFRNFEVRANYSFSHNNQHNVNRAVNVNYSSEPGVILPMPTGTTGGDELYESLVNHFYNAYNVYGTYGNEFGKGHNVKIVAGVNGESKYFKDVKAKQTDLLSENLDDFNLATGDVITLQGGQNKYKIFGVFYRANYDYKGRYLFEASGRYDGTSRFRRGNRFGFFPSFSAGWRVSEEPFFEGAKNTVSNLKLRLSYGSLGNQQVGYYDYMQQISTGGLLNYSFGDGLKAGYADETDPNASDLTWEKVTTKNIGIDIGFLRGRLNIEADAYIRDTKAMLMDGMALPAAYGAKSPKMNAASLRTSGWEMSVSWNDSFTVMERPFNYSVSFGIGDNTSKVTKYDSNPSQRISGSTFYKGQQLGSIWGYVVDGYFKTDEEARNYHVDQSYVNYIIQNAVVDKGLHAGDLKYVDLDGDNVISPTQNANNQKDQKIIGNSLPRYNYNINASANWNGIDFSVFFQGIGRQHWYPGSEAEGFWGPYSRPYASFIPKDFMSKVWSEDNPDAYFPRPRGYIALNVNPRSLSSVNTKYLQNLAYCRLKNLTVGYTLPQQWTSKVKIEKFRIYFSGENLLTFTKLESDYIDPEQASAGNSYKSGTSDARLYPWSKTFSFGIDVTF